MSGSLLEHPLSKAEREISGPDMSMRDAGAEHRKSGTKREESHMRTSLVKIAGVEGTSSCGQESRRVGDKTRRIRMLARTLKCPVIWKERGGPDVPWCTIRYHR